MAKIESEMSAEDLARAFRAAARPQKPTDEQHPELLARLLIDLAKRVGALEQRFEKLSFGG